MITIKNVSRDAVGAYIVARECDGEWWYWGRWTTLEEATTIAEVVGGQVFNESDVICEVR